MLQSAVLAFSGIAPLRGQPGARVVGLPHELLVRADEVIE